MKANLKVLAVGLSAIVLLAPANAYAISSALVNALVPLAGIAVEGGVNAYENRCEGKENRTHARLHQYEWTMDERRGWTVLGFSTSQNSGIFTGDDVYGRNIGRMFSFETMVL